MQQLVKTYKSGRAVLFSKTAAKKFSEDAEKLAEDGWYVQAQSTKDGRMLDNTVTEITVLVLPKSEEGETT